MPNPRNFLVGTILDNFSSHLIICLFFWVLQLVLLNVSPHPLYNLVSRHLIPSNNISKFFRQFHRSCVSSGLPGALLPRSFFSSAAPPSSSASRSRCRRRCYHSTSSFPSLKNPPSWRPTPHHCSRCQIGISLCSSLLACLDLC